jgi:hypothetical protein
MRPYATLLAPWLAALTLACSHEREGEHASKGATGPSAKSHAEASAKPKSHGKKPAKAKRPSTTPRPELPKLADHPKPVDKGKDDPAHYPCGSVWDGETDQPLDCLDTSVDAATARAARVVIPYASMPRVVEQLPTTVDHRVDGYEGRTLTQGKVGSCTAFAFTSAADHGIALWTGKPADLSVMQVWARYHVGSFIRATEGNLGKTLAPDAEWAYDQALAKGFTEGKKVPQDKLAALDAKGIAIVEEVEQLPAGEHLFDAIRGKLAAGRDVVISVHMAKPFSPIGKAGAKYIPETVNAPKGGHMMNLVGYDVRAGGEVYYLLKNSWGPQWGDDGYAWIHETTLKHMLAKAFVVDVSPLDAAARVRPKRAATVAAACADDELPDAITGACASACEDGSPEHDGTCGEGGDCGQGFVTFGGECVLSAPRGKGTDPASKVAWACGAAGCAYSFANGGLGCTSEHCQKSCPAPDFRLAEGKSGLVCVE